ncbi:MAG: LysR family transcriptional regulator [Bacteroidales bacterium]|nr:LysR family transcriptional regulator [Bacteroidales bacterium]MBP5764018.1 LysR family transcriptional regulator [Bacteroidales bacterium]
MELRQLKYFVKVAELKSFSEASRQLNVTQSTLSQQIRQLESELNIELLIRDSHHVDLTDMGQAFLPQAQKTLTAAKTCIDRIRDVQQLGFGELNIGSTYSFLPLLKETVLQYIKKYPGVKLNICCHSMETLINMLDEQNIDVALSYKPTTVHPEIESHIIFDNQLAIFVSDTHPLAARESVRLADLEKFPFAMPAKGLQARNAFDRIINGLDYRFDIRLEINEVNLLMDLVRSSDKMVTVLSRAASVRVPGIKALTLDQQGTQMEGSFHILKNAYMKRSAKEFLRILCENRAYGLAIMDML